jgi:tight adherence protein C
MLDAIASSFVLRLTALLGIFLAVVICVSLVARLTEGRAVIRRRLAEPGGSGALAELAGSAFLREREQNRSWIRMTEAIERAGIPLTDAKDSALHAKLTMAGFTSPAAASLFTLCRLLLMFALPGLYLLLASMQGSRPSVLALYLVSAALALIGMYLPNLWLTLRADARKREIVNGFPDCLDLMLVCVEAGLGMEAAFDRVGREIVRSHPRLAELLSAVTLELRAGASREQALRGMAQRAQVDQIKAFATLLIQSDKLGTSIGTTLRVYSTEMREKRRLRAEEKAHRLPVLLSIPLVACMLPTMIGVLMLPAAIRVVRIIMPIMRGTS